MNRGLRQGFPLSMILYITFAEIFLENKRQNNGIIGIVIGGTKLKTFFVNHTTIYIRSNSPKVHLKTQLMHFDRATDINFNKTKCVAIWLGSNKGNPRKPLGFK